MSKSAKNEGPSYTQFIYKILTRAFNSIKGFFRKKNKDLISDITKLLKNHPNIGNDARLIITNCLKFIDKTVEEIIIPRSDICAVKSTSTIDEINKTLLQSSHTRILVYEENLDNIIGFVHIKDLYKNIISGQKSGIVQLIRKPITVVPSTKLIHLLSRMQQERIHLAVVADEYGGTEGIVTNEDVIEALVGAIHDEHDSSKNLNDEYQLLDEKTLITSARVKIEKIEELLKVDLNQYLEGCDTIGGIVIAVAGKMPQVGATLNINDQIRVEVLEANKRSLKKVKLKLISDQSQDI
jgi:CBS domain containing-hemolysin-like protein